jgi:hypothetical protein
MCLSSSIIFFLFMNQFVHNKATLDILLFTHSRAQGNVDKILARWRLDLAAPVEEAEDTLPCSAVVKEQHSSARSLVGLQVLLGSGRRSGRRRRGAPRGRGNG